MDRWPSRRGFRIKSNKDSLACKMPRLYFLYFFTVLTQMVGGVLPLLWLHDQVTAIFLIPAAIAGAMFFYLLRRHETPRQKAYTVYAALYLGAVVLYSALHVTHPR
jgi:drug/metabolite transporter superfamily protein YnfA